MYQNVLYCRDYITQLCHVSNNGILQLKLIAARSALARMLYNLSPGFVADSHVRGYVYKRKIAMFK